MAVLYYSSCRMCINDDDYNFLPSALVHKYVPLKRKGAVIRKKLTEIHNASALCVQVVNLFAVILHLS